MGTRQIFVGALLLAACDGGLGSEVRTTVIDSAGVRLVTIPPGPRDTAVLGEPTLTIGQPGSPEYEFYQIGRVLGLDSGEIVVANASSRELRWYSMEGRYLGAVGRRGDGPGEFRFLGRIERRAGDTVIAHDGNARRLSSFGPSRELVRTWSYGELQPLQVTGGCGVPSARGLAGTGVLLVTHDCFGLEGTDGARDWTIDAVLWDPSTNGAVVLPRVASPEAVVERPSRPFFGRQPFWFQPLAPVPGYAAGVQGAWSWSGTDYSLRSYAADGHLSMVIRDQMPRTAVGDALWEEYLSGVDEDRRAEEQALTRPDSIPAFAEAFVAGEQVWARHYGGIGSAAAVWSVYGEASGNRITTVTFPRGFRLTDVRNGLAYGVSRDSLDVETVTLYPLPTGLHPGG